MAPCRTCRQRQLSCDEGKPTCRRCRDDGRPCTQRFNVRFSRRRAWIPTDTTPSTTATSPSSPPSAALVTEQRNLRSTARGPRQGLRPQSHVNDQSLTTEVLAQPDDVDHQANGPVQESSIQPEIGPHPSTDLPFQCNSEVGESLSHSVSVNTTTLGDRLLPSDEPSAQALQHISSHEAYLLQYFSTTLGGPWLDLTDPDFTIEVLALAPRCPALYFSVMALASFHHSQRTGQHQGEDEVYHQKAVTTLLTLMRSQLLLEDGAGLASAVILRLYEESKGRQNGLETESHLLAGNVFSATIANGRQHQKWTRLATAAYWVHQRQDVFHAVVHQKSTRTCLSSQFSVELDSSTNDMYRWAKKIQLLAGETADFCFASDDAHASEQATMYSDLHKRLSDWAEQSWPLFQPILQLDRDLDAGRILPEIRFVLNGCLIGYAHHILARLLLAVYNPTSLTLGPRAIEHHKTMEVEVQNHVRSMCGVAKHNTCPVGRAMAGVAITLGAGWINDSAERLEMLELLRLSEKESGWSNRVSEQQLRQIWGMSS